MAAKGQRKKPEAERRYIVERYEAYQRNLPKRICRDHGIAYDTLKSWVAEFQERG